MVFFVFFLSFYKNCHANGVPLAASVLESSTAFCPQKCIHFSEVSLVLTEGYPHINSLPLKLPTFLFYCLKLHSLEFSGAAVHANYGLVSSTGNKHLPNGCSAVLQLADFSSFVQLGMCACVYITRVKQPLHLYINS